MVDFLAALLAEMIRILIKGTLIPTMLKSEAINEREKRLKRKLRKDGWVGSGVVVLILLSVVLPFSGCSSQAVYVPDGKAVMLREKIEGAKVWVKTEGGQTIPAEMDLPEGWYCLPDTEEE